MHHQNAATQQLRQTNDEQKNVTNSLTFELSHKDKTLRKKVTTEKKKLCNIVRK